MFKKILNSKNIKTAAIGSLIIKFLSAFFGLISSITLAKILGLNGYGMYLLSFTTVILLSIPISLGIPFLITRYISKYETEGNTKAIKGLLIRSYQYVIFSTSIIFILFYLSYIIWWNILNPILVKTLWYSFILIPILVLNSLNTATLRGLKFVVLGQLSDVFLRILLLSIGISYYYFTNQYISPSKAMLIHIIAAFISFMIALIILNRKYIKNIIQIKPNYHTKEWIKQTLPFSINSAIQVLKSKLSTYILAIFGGVETVAIFDMAMRGASLVAFTLDALNSAIAPYISTIYEKKDMPQLQKVVTKTSRLIFIFALPTALFFIFGGSSVLEIFLGKDYVKSYVPLVILCIGQLINAATGSVALVLNMTGNQFYVTKTMFFIITLNIILSIPAIYYFKEIGASIVFSLIIIIQNIILVNYTIIKLKINTTIFP